jgi:ATP-binding cassette subfamily B protein
MTQAAAISWSASRLGEALTALARHGGLDVRAGIPGAPPDLSSTGPKNQLGRWIEATADWLGFEAEPVQTPCAEVERCLAGPGLLRLPDANEPRFLVLLGGRRRLSLLTPDYTVVRLAREEVRGALCQAVEAPHLEATDRLLTEAGLHGRRRKRARQALLREWLSQTRIDVGWMLRRPAGGARGPYGGLPRLLGILLGAHLGVSLLWLLSWWVIGAISLHGRPEAGWLAAWLLLLLSLVPFRLLATFAGGLLSLRAGTALKSRLLVGALRLVPDEVRQQGVGQLLGRVLESEVVATLALTGGFLGLTAVVELVLAALVLGFGAGSTLHVLLLLGTLVATGLLTGVGARRRGRWTQERLDLTDDLIERMVGQRTRLAQQDRAGWHDGEDEALDRYLSTSARLDGLSVLREVLVPRGWFVVALLGLAPAYVWGSRSTPLLAAGVGGIVLAHRALRTLGEALDQLTAVAIAWGRVRLFWRAAELREPAGHPRFAVPAGVPGGQGGKQPLLGARGLVFRHADRGEPILRGVEVQIAVGDRLLLEGPSGGGKSTLAAVLSGGRAPESGLLLLEGLDPPTLGPAGWRRRVVLAPQFHENHVLMGTFAFNALLGRDWPPRPADLEEAEHICRALGLGPLLDRMPAGLQQVVGETGWQLSHGEKSRLYLARALLQRADLLILDESFAALDPENLQRALAFVLTQAPSLVVIAHP